MPSVEHAGEKGEGTASYVAVILLIASVVAGLVTTDVGDAVESKLKWSLCRVGGGTCEEQAGTKPVAQAPRSGGAAPSPAPRPSDPPAAAPQLAAGAPAAPVTQSPSPNPGTGDPFTDEILKQLGPNGDVGKAIEGNKEFEEQRDLLTGALTGQDPEAARQLEQLLQGGLGNLGDLGGLGSLPTTLTKPMAELDLLLHELGMNGTSSLTDPAGLAKAIRDLSAAVTTKVPASAKGTEKDAYVKARVAEAAKQASIKARINHIGTKLIPGLEVPPGQRDKVYDEAYNKAYDGAYNKAYGDSYKKAYAKEYSAVIAWREWARSQNQWWVSKADDAKEANKQSSTQAAKQALTQATAQANKAGVAKVTEEVKRAEEKTAEDAWYDAQGGVCSWGWDWFC